MSDLSAAFLGEIHNQGVCTWEEERKLVDTLHVALATALARAEEELREHTRACNEQHVGLSQTIHELTSIGCRNCEHSEHHGKCGWSNDGGATACLCEFYEPMGLLPRAEAERDRARAALELNDGQALTLYRLWSEEMFSASFLSVDGDVVQAFIDWWKGIRPTHELRDYEAHFLSLYRAALAAERGGEEG